MNSILKERKSPYTELILGLVQIDLYNRSVIAHESARAVQCVTRNDETH